MELLRPLISLGLCLGIGHAEPSLSGSFKHQEGAESMEVCMDYQGDRAEEFKRNFEAAPQSAEFPMQWGKACEVSHYTAHCMNMHLEFLGGQSVDLHFYMQAQAASTADFEKEWQKICQSAEGSWNSKGMTN